MKKTDRPTHGTNVWFIIRYLIEHGPSPCARIREALTKFRKKPWQISKSYYTEYFNHFHYKQNYWVVAYGKPLGSPRRQMHAALTASGFAWYARNRSKFEK